MLFREKENALWTTWQQEFETMHPNSFTAQKLYLLNPIRRKYPLKIEAVSPETSIATLGAESALIHKPAKPAIAKPAMPKPAVVKPVVSPKQEGDPEKSTSPSGSEPAEKPAVKPAAKPAIPRPVMKPKPKTDL